MDWKTLRLKTENFWYYYKWHTIGAIFIILTILVGIYSCSQKEDPDFHLLYIRDETPIPEQADALQDWLAEMVPDVNEDGISSAKVMSVARSNMWNGDDTQAMVVNVAVGDSVLYLVCENAYNVLHSNGVLQDLSFLGESPYIEGDRYNISANGALHQLKFEGIQPFEMETEPLYLCLRKVEGSSLEGQEKYVLQEELSVAVMKQIIADEK